MRAHPFTSLFAAALISLLPVHALAQTPEDSVSVRNRPRPEYDAMGMPVGGFDLNASLDLSVSSTDNVFADDVNEQDDIIFRASPYARLSSHWSRHALGVEGGATFSSYQDFSSEDSETAYGRVNGRLDVGSNTSVAATAGLAHEVEPRTDPDAPTTGDPVEYDRSDLGVTVQHRFNRLRLTGAAARTEYSYDGAQNFRDNEITGLRGRVEAELTPRVGALVEVSADERDYENDPGLNSEGHTFLVGATINFTDLMRGEIAVGQFERDYDDPAFGSVDGVAASGNLEWYITRLTTLSFNVRRNAESVVGGNTDAPYVETQYGGRVDHELMRNVILTGGVQVGTREYDVLDRDDDYTYADVGFDYFMNRRVVLRGRYARDEVKSGGADAYRDYEQNTLTLGVALRL